MATGDRFWVRRLRWRLIGAWRWPLFLVMTVVDALIVSEMAPTGGKVPFLPALFICSFGNLFLIGALAPWIARRLAARQGVATAGAPSTFPPSNHLELMVDRVAAAVLVLAGAGLLVAGLGNKRVVVADTERLERAGAAVRAYVAQHAPPEVRRRVDAANTHATLEDGFFRTCVPYEDARKQYCMFVDARREPPSVVRDRDTRPNAVYFRTPQ